MPGPADSATLFTLLVDDSPDIIERFDPEGRYLYVNRTFEKCFNRPGSGIIGKTPAEAGLPPEVAASFEAAFKRIRTTGKDETIELPLGDRVYQVRIVPETGPRGEIVSFAAHARDITVFAHAMRELRAAEDRLRERESTINAFFDNSPVSLTIFEEGMTFLRIDANSSKQFLGLAPDAVAGRTLWELAPDKAKQAEGTFRQIREDGKTVHLEITLADRQGRKHDFIATGFPLQLSGGRRGAGSVAVDITGRKSAERKLRESEEKYRTLVERAQEGIIIVQDGIVKYANPRMAILNKSSLEQIVGTPYTEHVYPPEIPKLTGIYRRRMAGETVPSSYETVLQRQDGEPAPVEINAALIDYEGRPADIVIIHDISGHKRAEEELRRREYEMRTLVDNSPDLIFRMNRQLQYVFVNHSYESTTGVPAEQFIGRTNRQLGMSQRFGDFWDTSVAGVLESGRESSVEFEAPGFIGKRYFFARLIPEFVRSGLVETVLVIARDITERRHAEEQIRYISFHDEVTGLFNRAFFEEEIRRVDTGRDLPVSLIMGDVNNLKLSNDVFGHEEGDTLLKAIADIFRTACRKSDVIARWGGDEFAVILPGTDRVTAGKVCGRVRQAAAERKGTVIRPGVALGVATKDNRDQNIYRTIRQAEERMYNNKLDESRKNEEAVFASLFACARERIRDLDAHIARSSALADAFGRELALSESQRDDLRLLIKLHDIGVAVLPEDLLKKTGQLTQAEWETLKKHSEAGLRIVKTFVDTARISDEVFSHGERWDGTGYPRGLAGKEIPFLARVFRLIDVFDVMTNPRPYARTFTREEATEELRRNAGLQFDPELTEVFVRMLTGVPAGVR